MYSCHELTREIQMENMISVILIKEKVVYFFVLLCFEGLASLVLSLWLTCRPRRRRDISALHQINLEIYFPAERFKGRKN
jgi:hypothetical protein